MHPAGKTSGTEPDAIHSRRIRNSATPVRMRNVFIRWLRVRLHQRTKTRAETVAGGSPEWEQEGRNAQRLEISCLNLLRIQREKRAYRYYWQGNADSDNPQSHEHGIPPGRLPTVARGVDCLGDPRPKCVFPPCSVRVCHTSCYHYLQLYRCAARGGKGVSTRRAKTALSSTGKSGARDGTTFYRIMVSFLVALKSPLFRR
jgi:hypothetical protein